MEAAEGGTVPGARSTPCKTTRFCTARSARHRVLHGAFRAPHGFAPRAEKSPLRGVSAQGASKRRLATRYFPALLGAVSSPRGPLTAVFGMGTGVSARQGLPTKGFGRKTHGGPVFAGANARACLLPECAPPSRPHVRASRRDAADKPHGPSEPLG